MKSQNEITRTLFAHLETLTSLEIYYVDSTEQPATDHIAAFILPAITTSDGLDANSAKWQFGILQANIFVKEAPGANIKAGDFTQTLMTGLQRGIILTGIRFDKVPDISAPRAAGGFLMVSVSAEYNVLS